MFDTEAARRIVEQVIDTRYPPPIRIVITMLVEACDYIDALEGGEPLQ